MHKTRLTGTAEDLQLPYTCTVCLVIYMFGFCCIIGNTLVQETYCSISESCLWHTVNCKVAVKRCPSVHCDGIHQGNKKYFKNIHIIMLQGFTGLHIQYFSLLSLFTNMQLSQLHPPTNMCPNVYVRSTQHKVHCVDQID